LASKRQIITIAFIAGLVLVSLLWKLVPDQTADHAVATSPPPPTVSPAAAPAPAAAEKPAAPAPKEPLAPLVPGSSLTDQRFAAMSAKIVVAALGLKRDKDWEVNVLAYMAKVLDAENVTETEFREYAEALGKYPDRARAVVENITDKAEKKLGYRVSMENLPMFKVDKLKVQEIDKKLQKKLR
jgi:hypothetical protein